MTGTDAPLLSCDLYEVAYLAGGPRRVVEAAVVAMIEDGRLRVFRSIAELHVVDPRPWNPVEAAVLDAAGPRARRSIDGVVRRWGTDARLVALADRLRQAGLVSRRGSANAMAAWPWTVVGLTRAGRHALRRFQSDPPLVGRPEALALALGRPRAWADGELLKVVVFAPGPGTPADPGSSVREAGRSSSGGYAHGAGGGWAGADFGGDCGGGAGGGGG